MGHPMRAVALLPVLTVLATAFLPIVLAGDSLPEPTGRPTKTKVFYLQSSTLAKNIGAIAAHNYLATTLGASGQEIQSTQRIIAEWYLYPELAGEVRLNGTASLSIWYQSTENGGTVTWDLLELDRVARDGTLSLINSRTGFTTPNPAVALSYQLVTVTLPVDTVASPLQAGESLRLRINLRGNAANDYYVAWGDTVRDSRLLLPTDDYLRIVPQGESGIQTADWQDRPRANFDPNATNKALAFYASVTDPFGGYDIAWANLTVRDPGGAILPGLDNVTMTRVSGFFNSFTTVFRMAWDYTGQPNGGYNITVTAVDQTGNYEFTATGSYGSHLETEYGAFSIGDPPLTVWVRVRNVANQTVSGATVEARLGAGTVDLGVTDSTGTTDLRLFPGTHVFLVFWTGVLVTPVDLNFTITADVPQSTPLEIQAFIISPFIHVDDANGVPLASAGIYLRHPNGTVDVVPRITNAAGEITLILVAAGDYDISVLWRGTIVAAETRAISENRIYLVPAAVYAIALTAVDQAGFPVPDAFLTITDPLLSLLLDSQVTDALGRASMRLPAGSFRLNATYFGRPVYGASFPVSGNDARMIPLAVFDVTFAIRDSRNETLEGASVQVSATDLARTADTPEDGRVTFKLPADTYALRVFWRGVLVVDRGGFAVGPGATTFAVTADVFYLAVTTVDRAGTALVGSLVSASADGHVWAAGFTDASGNAVLRLPVGEYRIDGEHRATIGLTDTDFTARGNVNLTADRTVTLRFSRLPLSPFEQVVTWIFLVLAILVALLLYLLYRKMGKAKTEPGEEMKGGETAPAGATGSPEAPPTTESPPTEASEGTPPEIPPPEVAREEGMP